MGGAQSFPPEPHPCLPFPKSLPILGHSDNAHRREHNIQQLAIGSYRMVLARRELQKMMAKAWSERFVKFNKLAEATWRKPFQFGSLIRKVQKVRQVAEATWCEPFHFGRLIQKILEFRQAS
ncbi:hypothetical protein CEXT_209131 [Caerostris extrusa]|uniref:Uncharacterized protein n=1 Tax=Caerostris extrusa TaxID=172846 RepID=A0AAV4MHL3_CAEEX|nr:hypothetical protein CEXT_209131 [Caerostris extrusa]